MARVFGVFVLLITFAFSSFGADGGGQVQWNQDWTKIYSQDDWTDHNPRLMNIAGEGYFVAGTSSYKKVKGDYNFRMWIWNLDDDGNRRWGKFVDVPGIDRDVTWSNIACLPDKRVILAWESLPKYGIWLMRFDHNGEIIFNKKLDMEKHYGRPRDFVEVKDGYLLWGSRYKDGWAAMLDFEGNVEWQKIYDKGASEHLISVAAEQDGSFVFAADSGEYNKFGGGKSSIWIAKCDNHGEIIKSVTFSEGRHPTIAKSGSGVYAVCYNAGDFPAVDMCIKALDTDLNELWKKENIHKGPGIGMYKWIAYGRDELILAGSKFGKIWTWKINTKDGRITGSTVGNEQNSVIIESLIKTAGGFMIAGCSGPNAEPVRDEEGKINKDVQWDISDIQIIKVTAE